MSGGGAGNGIPPKDRCAWVGADPLYVAYHDEEWGVPVHDDRRLFEMLVLEGAQAGLSWLTILKKREGYRRAFDGFDPEMVARYDVLKVEGLLADPGIVRNRRKVEATVRNARCFLEIREEFETFDRYLWGFVGGEPVQNRWRTLQKVPAETEASRVLSRDLKRRGFGFVGPTVIYAFMQAVGMVNDHTTDCFRHALLGGSTEY
jgi:DNA-3-methyladenine glycosylase I